MMNTLKYWVLVGLFSSTSISFGEDGAVVGFGSATTVPLKTNTQEQVSTASSGLGITDSAKKTQDSNKTGQILNMAIGAANLKTAYDCYGQCGSGGGGCCSMAPIFMLMGLQNLSQAKAQGNTAGQAGGTYNLTDTGLGSSDYDPGAVFANDPDLKKGLDFVESMTNADPSKGFSYDPKTQSITTATGKTVKSKDVGSAAAMEAAGISKGIIDGVGAMEKTIEAAARKKAGKYANFSVNGDEGGGGGGGSSDGSSSSHSSSDAALYGGGGRGGGLGIDRDPAQVAGMQKNYNGEPIGVAGDSIFKMMNRRYKTKESQNNFLDESELLQK